MIIARVFIISSLALLSCSRHDVASCTDQKALRTNAPFAIGAAVDYSALKSDPKYKAIVDLQFNSISPENIFKAVYIHPSPDVFNWMQADDLASYCRQNKKRLNGASIIWHQQLPNWILSFKGGRAEWEQLMKEHIQNIVGHFKGQASQWDVVNEAFNEDGTLRNSIWRENIGDGYIEKAFQFAHEADPDALLFYNDYNLESNPAKMQAALSWLNKLKSNGVPVHGVGLQMHINTSTADITRITAAFTAFAESGYRVHISELDISLNPEAKDISPTSELFNLQADLLGKIVRQYRQLPAKYQYGITFWGVTDKYSWIRSYYHRQDYPLLYDDHYRPKPCYCKLREVL